MVAFWALVWRHCDALPGVAEHPVSPNGDMENALGPPSVANFLHTYFIIVVCNSALTLWGPKGPSPRTAENPNHPGSPPPSSSPLQEVSQAASPAQAPAPAAAVAATAAAPPSPLPAQPAAAPSAAATLTIAPLAVAPPAVMP